MDFHPGHKTRKTFDKHWLKIFQPEKKNNWKIKSKNKIGINY